MNTRLRRFLVVSVILHIILACAAVVPYAVRRYLAEKQRREEQLARELAREEAEERAREQARDIAREKVEDVLEQDAREFLSESMDEAEFEQIWEDVLAAIAPDIRDILDQLEGLDFDLTPSQLEELLEALRARELEELFAKLAELTHEELAALILQQVRDKIPEFNQKVEEALQQEGGKVKQTLDATLAREKKRRDAARGQALRELEGATRELAKARSENKRLAEEVGRREDAISRHIESDKAKGDLPAAAKTHGDRARGALAAMNRALEATDGKLLRASPKAAEARHGQIASAVRDTAKALRGVAAGPVARTGQQLGEPKPGQFDTAPGALPAQELAKAERALAESKETTEQLAELADRIQEHTQGLREEGERFAQLREKALAELVSTDSATRHDAQQFMEQKLRENIAEEFRQRVHKQAVDALKSRGLPENEGFVNAVGQQAVETLLNGTTGPLSHAAFNSLMASSAAAYGVELPEGERDGDGTHGGDGENGTDGAHGDGAEETNGADGDGDGDGDAGLADAMAGAADNAAKTGIGNALAKASRTSLSLPSIGGGPSGLHMRLANAMQNPARTQGGSQTAIISLQRDLGRIAMARESGVSQIVLFRGEENDPEKLRENTEAMQTRQLDELLLSRPSRDTHGSAAETAMADKRNATILVAADRAPDEDRVAVGDPTDRKLAQPRFKTFAYGGAPLALKEPLIDGDLADWSDVEAFALRGTPQKAVWPRPLPAKWESNRLLMVQWSPKGLYFAYRMVDDNDNAGAKADSFWSNDALELFFDFANKRTDSRTRETQQFWFWPVGSGLGRDTIGGEAIMDGDGGKSNYSACFRRSTSPGAPRMAVRRTANPRGYHVEAFLPKAVFRKPDLRPGRIIAFNFSIDNGESCDIVWAVDLGKQFSLAPSLWGDLTLLGTDAEIAFVKPSTDDELTAVVPGEPVGLRVTDLDMNLSPTERDRVEVTLTTQSGDLLRGFLEESAPDTGIFTGSIDTELFLLQGPDRIADSTLQIAGGETIETSYLDQARRYGERNHETKAKLPVGLPVYALGR